MSVVQHLPALQVVVPLVAAPLSVLLRDGRAAFALALAAAWTAFAIAVALWLQVDGGGTLSYAIGSWAPPWGIEYRVDRLSSFVLVLVAGVAAVVLPYSWRSIARELPREQHYLFYTMFCCAWRDCSASRSPATRSTSSSSSRSRRCPPTC
jgi:multicomponent Na+:H+ antiporter subunit D